MITENEKKKLLQSVSVKLFGVDYVALNYPETLKVIKIVQRAIATYTARLEHGFI